MSLSTLSGFAASSVSNPVLHRREAAPCQEWQIILDKYRLAAQAHSEAVASLTYLPGAGFAEAWLRAERARKNCDGYRAQLLDHEHNHACLVRKGAESGRQKIFFAPRTDRGENDLMHLVPTQEEVVALLRRTGGLREGHFEYPNGLHASEYLQVALTMRYYESAKILGVGLSRQLRGHADIRAMIPELSVVAPATGGLPVAYGVCEALRARQVYWSERENANEPMRFREFLDLKPGEKVLLVDDILRTGQKLSELKTLVESQGGEVVGLAVIIYQPFPDAIRFDPLPFYYLAQLDQVYYKDAASCDQCKRGVPVEKVRA